MSDSLLVTARLASPLAGDPPHLDGLLESVLSLHHAKGDPGYKIDRNRPAPPQAAIPIPIARRTVEQGGPDGEVREWVVGCCSSPILGTVLSESVEYVAKRIAVEHSGWLAPDSRLVVSTTNSWTKSYRLPLRVRVVDRVAWFTVGDRQSVRRTLKKVRWIGKKVSIGYGRVVEWTVERTDADYSWFAPSDHGPVLMRPLPVTDAWPPGLLGVRRDFGACCPPYWHPERYTEILIPC
ncbi:MAG: hypothetical protein AB7G11_02435 [Phycisphaerales bacterium]